MSKSKSVWLDTKVWCVMHPSKIAAIVTPEGIFTIKFKPKSDMKLSDDSLERIRWIKGLFLND